MDIRVTTTNGTIMIIEAIRVIGGSWSDIRVTGAIGLTTGLRLPRRGVADRNPS
jgi:hypothetical protein